LKTGSIAPDNWDSHQAKYHGKSPELYDVIKARIAMAVKSYKHKQYYDASYQVGVALHTQQDYFAHNIVNNKGGLLWWKDSKWNSHDEHTKYFDSVEYNFQSGGWNKQYTGKKGTIYYSMNNPRITKSIDKSVEILNRFLKKVS